MEKYGTVNPMTTSCFVRDEKNGDEWVTRAHISHYTFTLVYTILHMRKFYGNLMRS